MRGQEKARQAGRVAEHDMGPKAEPSYPGPGVNLSPPEQAGPCRALLISLLKG